MIETRAVDSRALALAAAPVFAEMLAHYGHGRGEDVAAVGRFLAGALLDPSPTVFMTVACEAGAVVGFATFAVVIPGGGLGRELFLKELFTAAASRGRGAGRALMAALAGEAVARGCSRMRWTTGRDDAYAPARALYEEVGGVAQPDALLYMMDRQAIERLAAS